MGIERRWTIVGNPIQPGRTNIQIPSGSSQPFVRKQTDSEGDSNHSSPKKFMSSKMLGINDLDLSLSSDDTNRSDVNKDQKVEESKVISEVDEYIEDTKIIEDKLSKPSNENSEKINKRKRANSFKKDRVDSEEIKEEIEADLIETSFASKDSGNWRLNLIKTSAVARTGDRIRRDLLSKLTLSKIWLTPSQKPESHQTVFIYDWDDTLLCTSFLNPTGFYDETSEVPEIAKKHLEKLEKAVEKVLTSSVKHGRTFIVTNAAEGWVQFSSQKYMPLVYEALKKIEVISARSLFESMYPGDSYEWKIQAFTNIQKELQSSAITNIIAWGDSKIEMEAARHIAKLFNTAFIKTVKFKETPTPEELIKQLNLVIQKLDHIWSAPRNLTIRLERKQTK